MLSVVLSSARSYLFANDANVSYFSPDKVKAFEGLTIFLLVKKATSDSFFALQKSSTRKLVTNNS
jgi:hypothetical protein